MYPLRMCICTQSKRTLFAALFQEELSLMSLFPKEMMLSFLLDFFFSVATLCRWTSYALAVSLPEEVSGLGLATAAGISHLCNSNTCRFTYGWTRINTLVPVHNMNGGHGFAVRIFPQARQSAGSEEQQSVQSPSSHEGATGSQNGRPMNDHQGPICIARMMTSALSISPIDQFQTHLVGLNLGKVYRSTG